MSSPATSETSDVSNNYAWYIVAVLLLASIVAYLDRLVMGFLVDPIKNDLGFSDTQMGMLNGLAFTVFYVLMGIPLGRLVDVKNRKIVVSVCIIIWSCMTAFCGLARNFTMLFIARAGVGIGEAGLNPGAMSIISDLFSKERVAKPIAVYTLSFYIGGGLAIILGGQLIEYFNSLGSISLAGFKDISSWRLVFFCTGLPGLIVAALMLLTVREPERKQSLAARHKEEAPSLTEVMAFIKINAKLYTLMFGSFIAFGFYLYAVLGWYPAMLMRTYGIGPGQVALSYGFVYLIAGTSGALAAGPIINRISNHGRVEAPIIVCVTGMCILILPAVASPLMPNLFLCLACFAIMKFCWGMIMTASFTSILIVTPGRMQGVMIASYLVLLNITGGSLGAILVGVLSDNWFGADNVRYSVALVAAVWLPVSAVLFMMLKPVYRNTLT
ncbi:MAG: MFS family permease, partial [Planctomycetota bacterium]